MPWATPQYSHWQVDRSGDALISSVVLDGVTLDTINNWRASHAFPLQCLKMTLLARARKIYPNAMVAQRLKRLQSISVKLGNNKNMKLSKMNDLGGCRAVLRSAAEVQRLVRLYEKSAIKNPNKRAEFVKKYDYISQPKEDGYRSIHLVYKYRTASKKHRPYNGLRIEIQIRTRLQHAWATAVETVSTFTGRSLRSGIGDSNWKRFFALMGTAIALREKRPVVPGIPSEKQALVNELRALYHGLKVGTALSGWSAAVNMLKDRPGKADSYLLTLDANDFTINIQGFGVGERAMATQAYSLAEKDVEGKTNMQVVLVSVDSVRDLRRAYPNYFLDTRAFLDAVQDAIK
jgi:hypothetical protein